MNSKSLTSVIMVLSVAALFLLALPTSFAQWSSDPSVNLAICDTSGSQELPKIAATSDGGCYVSWFDTRGGGYKVYMQRLDAQGVKQWATNGLLISANPQNTSLVDYDLAVDDSNYAIVVFTDIRNAGQIEPFAYRISPQGNFTWGANGVALSTSSATFQPNPKVVSTSDGNYVFAWIFSSTPNKVALQKLNAAGTKQWGVDPIFLLGTGTENLTHPSLVRSDAGSVILLMSGYTGTFLNPQNYRLYTQKFSPAGAPLWGTAPDTVYSLGRVTGYFVPKIFPDGNNGAFYVWQDDRNSQNSTHSYIQHFSSTGVPLYPINGSAGSTSSSTHQFDAWMAMMPSSGEAYMFWKEANSLQSQFAIYGQRFSTNGTRLWPDLGREFKPFGSNSYVNQICFTRNDKALVYFNESLFGSNNNLIKGFSTDSSGALGWGGLIINVSTPTSAKLKIEGTRTSNGNSLLVWADNRVDGNGVYAQNVKFDGTLGNTTGVEATDPPNASEFVLAQNFPNPFNPSTNIKYHIPNTSRISLAVYNILGQRIATLKDEVQNVGYYDVVWDGRNEFGSQVSSGVYFCRIEARPVDGRDVFTSIKRMMFLK